MLLPCIAGVKRVGQKGRKGEGSGGKETLDPSPFSLSHFPPLPSPSFACVCHTDYNVMHAKQGPVPERLINANPVFVKFFTFLCIAWSNILCYHCFISV